MKRLIQMSLLMASVLFGSTAMAARHDVIILQEGYFPTTVYFSSGDTIRFTNSTGETVHLGAPNIGWIKTYLGGNSSWDYTIPNWSSLSVNGPKYAYRYNNSQGNFSLSLVRRSAPTSCPNTQDLVPAACP